MLVFQRLHMQISIGEGGSHQLCVLHSVRVIAMQAKRVRLHTLAAEFDAIFSQSYGMGGDLFRRAQHCIRQFAREKRAVGVVSTVGEGFVGHAQAIC